MSPGWMPMWPRPIRASRVFTHRRRRVCKPDRLQSRASEPLVAFGAPELPVATIHSMRGVLYHWASVRLSWVRPRAVPALVALVALVGLLAVTQHLTNLGAHGDAIASAPVSVQPLAP